MAAARRASEAGPKLRYSLRPRVASLPGASGSTACIHAGCGRSRKQTLLDMCRTSGKGKACGTVPDDPSLPLTLMMNRTGSESQSDLQSWHSSEAGVNPEPLRLEPRKTDIRGRFAQSCMRAPQLPTLTPVPQPHSTSQPLHPCILAICPSVRSPKCPLQPA